MQMKWLQAIQTKQPQHKYAINAAMLGDHNELAWSNLGYWSHTNDSYPQACRQLAIHLATAVDLNSKDKLLDLGCGKGASLVLWHEHFKVQHIEAVELQAACVDNIQNKLQKIHSIPLQNIQQCSFLNLKQCHFEFKFDVVLCIDAAYHCHLNSFLTSVNTVLNSKARIGFHSLMLTEKFHSLSTFQKLKLKTLLKCADVELSDLMDHQGIENLLSEQGFENIQIENLTQKVLKGFADYIQQRSLSKSLEKASSRLDRFKMEMTAKLCRKLYIDGCVDYVQISAQKRN